MVAALRSIRNSGHCVTGADAFPEIARVRDISRNTRPASHFTKGQS
jgi:hypothetical protein